MATQPRRRGDGWVADCSACDGTGSSVEIEAECCGNYLPTGECCAAQYGTANLVPVERQLPRWVCGGLGEVEL